jgi:hypothetical protein
VFAHQRLAPLLQHGRRVLEPLPGRLGAGAESRLTFLNSPILTCWSIEGGVWACSMVGGGQVPSCVESQVMKGWCWAKRHCSVAIG